MGDSYLNPLSQPLKAPVRNNEHITYKLTDCCNYCRKASVVLQCAGSSLPRVLTLIRFWTSGNRDRKHLFVTFPLFWMLWRVLF